MTLTRRGFLGSLGVCAAACASGTSTRPPPLAQDAFDIVDLTHVLSPSSPYIRVRDATFPFRRSPIATIEERGVYANRWELTEHIGTHIDAPCHFTTGAPCLDGLALEDLWAAAVVVDVAARAALDPDVELTTDDLDRWESTHGPLPARCVVLMRSGWDARWPSQERFANADAAGTLHFPGFSAAAMARLARAPEVLGIGVDTLSIDPGRDARFEGHHVLSDAGKWALECLAHLDRLPARGAYVLAAALNVEAASGGPARVMAWVPRRGSA